MAFFCDGGGKGPNEMKLLPSLTNLLRTAASSFSVPDGKREKCVRVSRERGPRRQKQKSFIRDATDFWTSALILECSNLETAAARAFLLSRYTYVHTHIYTVHRHVWHE